MPVFLLEIGLEEIPASMISNAQADLAKRCRDLLLRERLATDALEVKSFSTPRRLAVVIDGLLAKQVEVEEQVVGPSTSVAYKNGTPTPAAIAFAKKSGVEVDALGKIQNAKGEYVVATVRRPGRSAAEVLTASLPAEIAALYWPKNMYWRAGKPERFVRPVRWLLALLDEEVLPVEFAGIKADALSYGHRVLHGEKPVVIRTPKEYAEKLKAAFVEVDPDVRRHRIRKALDAATREIPGARWRPDEPLLETVTHLTEWPSVVLGSFDASYLTLPEEVLVTVMRDHQKYFALEDANGKLLPNFLAVLNIEVDPAGAAIIRHGNERVLRARFNDARFFWDVDQKIPLVDRVEMLKNVTFQKDIGSYFDKTEKNENTAQAITQKLYGQYPSELKEAIRLAKTDLTTDMVKEFTELQGIVGGLYAKAQGLPEKTSDAIYEHYRPQGANDAIPETEFGAIAALADKMTTIVQMFSKGLIPSGSKDPFALRRAGTGIIRILTENQSLRNKLHLITVVHAPSKPGGQESHLELVWTFMLDRLEFYLQESCGVRLQTARAVRNSGAAGVEDNAADRLVGYGHIADFAKVLNEQIGSPNMLAVAELLKRTSNILRQAKENKITHLTKEKSALLNEPAEVELSRAVTEAESKIQKNYRDGNYTEVIAAIAALQQPLNAFFDSVMVMVEDTQIRDNRLALLARTESTVRWAADFSELASIQS